MTRFSPLALALLLPLTACADDPLQPQPQLQDRAYAVGDFNDGTYLVRFPSGIPANFEEQVSALGGEVIFAHAGAGVGAVSGLTSEGATQLQSVAVQLTPDALVEIDALQGDVEAATVEGTMIDADAPNSPTNPATSFFYSRQWNMRAIQANSAWTAGKLGSSSVKVGILDTGIDYLHPDLYGRVDLALSRSFLSTAENNRVTAAFPGAHLVADLNYHGTHVAATVVSNGLAAAGVTSRVTLVGLKVCSPGTPANGWRGSCPTSGTLNAILYAADNGIPVLNMSLGGSFQRRAVANSGGEEISFLETINAVFNYARDRGTTIIVSAGNEAMNMQNNKNVYKTYCDAPGVVCVSATGPALSPAHGVYENVDALAPYSNYGGKVSIAAPGGAGSNVPINRGWVYAACSGFSLPIPGCQSRFYNPATGAWSASVVGINGTSMASPHAAGVAAIIVEMYGPGAVRNYLASTSDDLGKRGKDPIYGAGRINARKAYGL